MRYEKITEQIRRVISYWVDVVAIEDGRHEEEELRQGLSILEGLIKLAETIPEFPEDLIADTKAEYDVLKGRLVGV